MHIYCNLDITSVRIYNIYYTRSDCLKITPYQSLEKSFLKVRTVIGSNMAIFLYLYNSITTLVEISSARKKQQKHSSTAHV